MKRISIIGSLCLVAPLCFSQAPQSFVASISGVDRIALVKTSIDVPTWHEKSFFTLYENYLEKIEDVSTSASRTIVDLSNTDESLTESEAFENGRKMLAHRHREIAVRREYFQKVGNDFNGVIALQFLQTESMIDMVESCHIYDASIIRKFRIQPAALSSENFRSMKYNIIANALKIPSDKKEAFWITYKKYEEECDALLGENYDLIGQCAGEATDYTPALAKRLGGNLINIVEREVKLKEKYFHEMNKSVGSSLAARFLAWEDYYSLVSKMHAWADAP